MTHYLVVYLTKANDEWEKKSILSTSFYPTQQRKSYQAINIHILYNYVINDPKMLEVSRKNRKRQIIFFYDEKWSGSVPLKQRNNKLAL